mmetsp:Transcript_6837/g.28345  ORF Transcript_6837/g.28345 Transcript_6837/m.28345 type:complete len:346 (-) Transcript_6837:77-1114(-)
MTNSYGTSRARLCDESCGLQSMALNAGGGSFWYGDEILNEFGPAVSPLDPSFLSSTARRLSTGGFPGPSVLGLPTTAIVPSASSHVCTQPSAPPVSIVAPSARIVIARIPPYVVVPSFRFTRGPGSCAPTIRCAIDTVQRVTASWTGWHRAPSSPRCDTVQTPSAPDGKPVTITSRLTYTAETMFSPPTVTCAPFEPLSPTPGGLAAAAAAAASDRLAAEDGLDGGLELFALAGPSLDSGVMDLESAGLGFGEETPAAPAADPGREDVLDAAASAAAAEILPSPVFGSPGFRCEQSATRKPSLRRPISPTHRSSAPTLTLRHTLMCLAPYVTNSSMPGNGFHTAP